jgi:hypothetical protein
MDQQLERPLLLGQLHDNVPGLLIYPGAVWVRCTGDELEPARCQREKEEHLDPLQCERLNGEEITGERVAACWRKNVRPILLLALVLAARQRNSAPCAPSSQRPQAGVA